MLIFLDFKLKNWCFVPIKWTLMDTGLLFAVRDRDIVAKDGSTSHHPLTIKYFPSLCTPPTVFNNVTEIQWLVILFCMFSSIHTSQPYLFLVKSKTLKLIHIHRIFDNICFCWCFSFVVTSKFDLNVNIIKIQLCRHLTTVVNVRELIHSATVELNIR